jgi:phosphate transport system substrate-binding protein
MKKSLALLMVFALTIVLAACGGKENNDSKVNDTQNATAPKEETATLKGTIEIDGSSTVYPITEAVSEEFGKEHKEVRIPVGVSGTGGGFKRFCMGETAISNASRPIKDSEVTACKEKGVEYIELAVAYDGLSVLVNPENDWVDHLTLAELHEIFKPGSSVKKWSEVRAGWPEEEIKIFSPGADSGTFDYFTETINEKAQESRNDAQVTFSEDDNALVQGIEGNKYALGYFGFAYYEENKDKLKLVPVDGGKGPVAPSAETINNGTYNPLSRPLFVYVNKKELERPEVKAYVQFYIENAAELSEEVGYIRLPQENYDEGMKKIS